MGIDYKRLARVRDMEKSRATAQLHMALASAEIHREGAVGIQCDVRAVHQRDGAHLPRRTHIVGAQIIDPACWLPPGKHANHQQQACGYGQPTGPLPHTTAFGFIHG